MSQHENEEQEITVKDLLEAGAHFGHQTRRWNPKMRRFIYEARNGIYIINLAKTMQQIREGVDVVQEVVSRGESILFVGTKKQAKPVIRELAEMCGEYYICERWLGGTLTNLQTIRKSIRRLDRIEKQITPTNPNEATNLTKKELVLLTKEQIKLERNLSGIRAMRRLPGLLIVVDPHTEHIAVAEANKLGIPVLALTDTNCDPDPIDHIIACNDDALKSIRLILQALAFSVLKKKQSLNIMISKETGSSSLYSEEDFNKAEAEAAREEIGAETAVEKE